MGEREKFGNTKCRQLDSEGRRETKGWEEEVRAGGEEALALPLSTPMYMINNL